ncbi:MAG: hypothetical protein IKN17_01085 [Ruminococcus sp.]|nr:hypothetical protein [Ruminococcus sp.]
MKMKGKLLSGITAFALALGTASLLPGTVSGGGTVIRTDALEINGVEYDKVPEIYQAGIVLEDGMTFDTTFYGYNNYVSYYPLIAEDKLTVKEGPGYTTGETAYPEESLGDVKSIAYKVDGEKKYLDYVLKDGSEYRLYDNASTDTKKLVLRFFDYYSSSFWGIGYQTVADKDYAGLSEGLAAPEKIRFSTEGTSKKLRVNCSVGTIDSTSDYYDTVPGTLYANIETIVPSRNSNGTYVLLFTYKDGDETKLYGLRDNKGLEVISLSYDADADEWVADLVRDPTTTKVVYPEDEMYYVTIPAQITLGDDDNNKAAVSLSHVRLAPSQLIKVALTETNDPEGRYRLFYQRGNTVPDPGDYVEYNIETLDENGQSTGDLKLGDYFVGASTPKEEDMDSVIASQDLRFVGPLGDGPRSAGLYKGTVTFTVSLFKPLLITGGEGYSRVIYYTEGLTWEQIAAQPENNEVIIDDEGYVRMLFNNRYRKVIKGTNSPDPWTEVMSDEEYDPSMVYSVDRDLNYETFKTFNVTVGDRTVTVNYLPGMCWYEVMNSRQNPEIGISNRDSAAVRVYSGSDYTYCEIIKDNGEEAGNNRYTNLGKFDVVDPDGVYFADIDGTYNQLSIRYLFAGEDVVTVRYPGGTTWAEALSSVVGATLKIDDDGVVMILYKGEYRKLYNSYMGYVSGQYQEIKTYVFGTDAVNRYTTVYIEYDT